MSALDLPTELTEAQACAAARAWWDRRHATPFDALSPLAQASVVMAAQVAYGHWSGQKTGEYLREVLAALRGHG